LARDLAAARRRARALRGDLRVFAARQAADRHRDRRRALAPRAVLSPDRRHARREGADHGGRRRRVAGRGTAARRACGTRDAADGRIGMSITAARALIVLGLVLVLGGVNYAIYGKERIVRNGETIFLELAPVDPRSL